MTNEGSRPADLRPLDASQPHAVDNFALREDLRRVSVPIDQFASWRSHLISFAIWVLGPALIALVYFSLIAAGQYATDFRFSVRSASELASTDNIVALLSRGAGNHEIGRLPYMVASYLRSRNVVDDLDRNSELRRIFSRSEADWFSRFDANGSIDDLWSYWQTMTNVVVDRVTGLILVRVRAFSPDDSLALAKSVIKSAEKMIDKVAERARRDALRLSEDDLERATQRYSDSLVAMRDVENQLQMVDPKQTLDAAAMTLLGVMREKLALERQHKANFILNSSNSPQQRMVSSQIKAVGAQADALSKALTSTDTDVQTAAQAIGQFEEAALERRFSERLLEVAQAGYERASQEAERQHIYLAVFVEPKLPEIAEYPHVVRSVAFAAIASFAIWSVVMMTIAGVRDHRLEP